MLRHKYYVYQECAQRGLHLRGLVHDWTKFRPVEWGPYRDFFYGGWRQSNYQGESAAPTHLKLAYDRAWNHHMHKNDHHWQFWIMKYDDGGPMKVLPMTEEARTEMLCDWIGAGKALGQPDTKAWYLANRDNIILDPATRAWIRQQLGVE